MSYKPTDNVFILEGDITPSAITSTQNNYSPSGLDTATVLRLSGTANRTITGIAGGTDGRMLILMNVGSYRITLSKESGSSTAANRFLGLGTYTLFPDESIILMYDSTSARWRILEKPPPTSQTTTTLSGTQDNLTLNDNVCFLTIISDGTVELTGITGGYSGRMLLVKAQSGDLYLKYLTSSSSINQIQLYSGIDTLLPSQNIASLVHNGTYWEVYNISSA